MKKISVIDKVEFTVLLLSLVVFVLISITKTELLLLGILFDEFFISSILFAISVIVTICNAICKMKRRNLDKWQKNLLVILCIMAVVGVIMNTFMCYRNIKNAADTERITLSDGNGVLLSERIDYNVGTNTEYTYMDVYQINGIIAKELGRIDETYFSNKCLSQDKYAYEYDETGKKLTVICEYGTYGDSVVRLKEEYDTGFWSEEFTLE